MDYLPPGYVQRIGDERFPRFVIRDGLGQYWARDRWSDNPATAVLFYQELDAMEARNRYCLGDEADTFSVTVVLAVHARRWSAEELARHLKTTSEVLHRWTRRERGAIAGNRSWHAEESRW